MLISEIEWEMYFEKISCTWNYKSGAKLFYIPVIAFNARDHIDKSIWARWNKSFEESNLMKFH